MNQWLRYLAQALLYIPFMAVVGYFSTYPAYTHIPEDHGLVRLSFSHAAQRLRPCRQRSTEELAKLPPNMRTPLDCSRERSNLTIELEMDGKPVYHAVIPPAGLSKDGAATVYQRLAVAAGSHRFVLRMRDQASGDFNYTRDAIIELRPGRAMVIDFDEKQGGFIFKQ